MSLNLDKVIEAYIMLMLVQRLGGVSSDIGARIEELKSYIEQKLEELGVDIDEVRDAILQRLDEVAEGVESVVDALKSGYMFARCERIVTHAVVETGVEWKKWAVETMVPEVVVKMVLKKAAGVVSVKPASVQVKFERAPIT